MLKAHTMDRPGWRCSGTGSTPAKVPKVDAATDRVCPGGRVTIRGTGFDDFQGWTNYPELGGFVIRAIKWTQTEIVAEIPAGSAPGRGLLAIYRDGATSNSRRVQILPADDRRCR
jgi:hypothetical protein